MFCLQCVDITLTCKDKKYLCCYAHIHMNYSRFIFKFLYLWYGRHVASLREMGSRGTAHTPTFLAKNNFLKFTNKKWIYRYYKLTTKLEEKQVLKSKLTKVLQKIGKDGNESLSTSTLNLHYELTLNMHILYNHQYTTITRLYFV